MSYTCRILAIDGGGIRGVIPAYILTELEAQLGKPIYQCFDIIAGTSTGGLIALGLTTPTAEGREPYTAQEVQDLYVNDESSLFVYQATGMFEVAKYYGTYVDPPSPDTGIEPWLQSIFDSTTLSQAKQWLSALGNPMPKQVLTTCYTMNGAQGVGYEPYQFNWHDAAKSADDDYCVWEAARATSAAPTYFPIANVGAGAANGSQARQRWVCDGGVTANNPALYALAHAFRLNLCKNLSDVLIVSVGTGLYNAAIQIPSSGDWAEGNWGMMPWTGGFDSNNNPTSPLLNVLSMSNQMVPDQQLSQIMPPENYMRFEPILTYGDSSMDGTDITALLKVASEYIAAGGAGYTKFQSLVAALGSQAAEAA